MVNGCNWVRKWAMIRTPALHITPAILSAIAELDELSGQFRGAWRALGSLPEQSARLFDLVRNHGRLTIGDAERLTGENRNTPKRHFRSLVADGHLALNGGGRGAWYSLR